MKMDKYSGLSLVGEGSFGRVYKATDNSTKSTVALKIISKRGRSDRELKVLRRECDIQRNLQHPNIIQMLDSFETKNEIVAITEFAKADLHTLLTREGSLGEQKAQKLTFDLVAAMYYLHSHRILHRDLKPQNILLDKHLCAKLCDFGLARNMTMGTHVLTSIKGTPLYMAPEILEAKPYDHQADLWSLGCIIFEMLAGEPPFSTTSILHLVRMIRDGYIKYPSFLSMNCITFLQGLLVQNPTQRLSWAQILTHPFVKGNILILEENIPESPFTNPLTASQSLEKEKQTKKIIYGENYERHKTKTAGKTKLKSLEDLASSRDSVNAILQSDLEFAETDCEDTNTLIVDNPIAKSFENNRNFDPLPFNIEFHQPIDANACYVEGNSNLIVNHFNENFPLIDKSLKTTKSHDLERRKLSQNIDNFSLRLETSMERDKKEDKKKTPTLLPGWDSCDESQNPPIENEEWLVFLQKSMQEVLDGELDTLKQQNFVSIIVAPLRNSRASAKVIEYVAQLLSLPLAIDAPPSIIADIKIVYAELKLVPNLVYASKLLCNRKLDESQSSAPNTVNSSRLLASLDLDEIKTLAAIYDLICFLIHSGDNFLNQFCDAIAILGAKELFVNFIAAVNSNAIIVRLTCSVLALLNCALRGLPENAEIIEQIVFDDQVDLIALMKHEDALLRLRTCMLFRILARFSCVALQKNWTNEIKETLENLLQDSDVDVRNEAEHALDEFKHLLFLSES